MKNTDNNKAQLHFLAGVSRAGITWLSRVLNRHPEIAVFGQSRFWGKHYIQPDPQGYYNKKHLTSLIQKIAHFEWDATVGDSPGCFLGITLKNFRDLLISAVENTAIQSVIFLQHGKKAMKNFGHSYPASSI